MRCTALALALLLIPAGALPSRAQAWGDGWRPCYGPCAPWMGGGWAGPPTRFAVPPAFAPGAWWSPRAVRWRRLAAWRRAPVAEHRPEAAPAAPKPRFSGWVWRRWPGPVAALPAEQARRGAAARPSARPLTPRDDETVAAMPAEALRSAQHPPRPVAAAHVFAAAMLRHAAVTRPVIHAVVRPPEPAVDAEVGPRAAAPSPRRPLAGSAPPRPLVHPAALRSQPAPVQPAPAAAPAIPAAAPAPAPGPTDVPVAPLD